MIGALWNAERAGSIPVSRVPRADRHCCHGDEQEMQPMI
jgi:hypothetical protein